jgi:serine/threonine protein kinase
MDHYEHHHELHDNEDHEYAEAFELMEKLLTIDYTKRPMASEALQHDFFGEHHDHEDPLHDDHIHDEL